MKFRHCPWSVLSFCLLIGAGLVAREAPADSKHFHPKGKPPSEHTIAALRAAKATLPLTDTRDFDEAQKGFIAAPDFDKIMADAGHVAWDMGRYDWLVQGQDFDSIHPSLERQSKLNMKWGLYEVIPGFYQVRGFDLANLTFVKGDTGWIVFDPLTAAETARAAMELVDKHLGKFPVKAVVYSHSHADHWAGVRGIVDEADVRAGKVQIIAPRGFMQYAVSENVFAGNAMNRRLFYQYGQLLPASPFGYTGQGLGQGVSAGSLGLIAPTLVIEKDKETHTVDGVEMEFKNTPGAEAPAQIQTWFPKDQVFWTGEDITGTFHNIYTLRGAQVRNAHRWSKYINEALYEYGMRAQIMIASHHWPRWGNARVQEVLRGQRDLYANINNQVLHLLNQGVTINQVHNVYETPKAIAAQWPNRGYHGSPQHNSRGVVNRFIGYWDANPATLIPLSPSDSAPLYVEMMGGADRIMERGRALFDSGDYMLAQEILNKLVHAQPENQAAKDLLADIFEQIGYQQENPGLRNSFLAGAYELRTGIPEGAAPDSSGPDVVRAMSTELFLDFLGVRIDSRKVMGRAFTINLITPDNGEKFVIELSGDTLTALEGHLSDSPDLTLSINRSDLEVTMAGAKSMADQISDGTAQIEGNAGLLAELGSMMGHFDPRFEILPGTKTVPGEEELLGTFEVGPIDLHEE